MWDLADYGAIVLLWVILCLLIALPLSALQKNSKGGSIGYRYGYAFGTVLLYTFVGFWLLVAMMIGLEILIKFIKSL